MRIAKFIPKNEKKW